MIKCINVRIYKHKTTIFAVYMCVQCLYSRTRK